tara:strand:+ start:67 stop:1230 length:1164 start_codon:yes stop_codon:yes gene_type:complete
MKAPLDNIRVIDLTRVLSGPFCTAMLADMGAEVIKIEHPDGGDDARHFGPFKNNKSLYFALINRNKKSISLDLKQRSAIEKLNELVRCADILVENFRPGVTKRLGVDFETMHEINPRLIYLSISGFGQDGPLAGKPALDTVVQAMSGIMATTGTQDADPTRVGESVADIITGIYGAWALSTALYSRSVNNEGLYLDLAMFDALFTSQVTNLSQLIATNSAPGRIGNRHPASAPFDSFTASDGLVIIAAATKTMFDQLCILMEQPDLCNDTRFLTETSRIQFEPELKSIIEKWTCRRSCADIIRMCEEVGIPVGPIWDIKTAAESENARNRSLLSDISHPVLETMQYVTQPVRFGGYRPTIKPEPELGANNSEILDGLAQDTANQKTD